MLPYTHTNGDGTFRFYRDLSGIGAWICVSGRCPGRIGGWGSNMVVPVMAANELTREAIESGADRKLFSRTLPKAEPVKTGGGSRRSSGNPKSRSFAIKVF